MGQLRIGIDARMIDHKQSGLGRYARALITHLLDGDPRLHYVVILRPGVSQDFLTGRDQVEAVTIPGWLDNPQNLISGPAINRLDLDLYHSLHHFLPLRLRVPRVVMTLHDLIWIEHAHLTFDTSWAWLRWRSVQAYGRATMWHGLQRADQVIAISHYSRHSARERYGLATDRITTVHHGVEHQDFIVQPHDPAADAAEEPSYLLSLGNTKPYKNVRGVLRAFALLTPRYPELRLRVVGRSDSAASLKELAAQLGIRPQVQFLGMVSQEQLAQLYRQAVALVFPSFIEGFGFPLLEAMAAGCPLVTSDIPVIHEVVEDAAVYADPHRPSSIAEAITRVLTDSQLREGLRQRGLKQAARFSWQRCAAETRCVYFRLLELELD